MNRATLQMSKCVNFNHCWKNNGAMTCSTVVLQNNKPIDLAFRHCVLIDNVDCPDYQLSEDGKVKTK